MKVKRTLKVNFIPIGERALQTEIEQQSNVKEEFNPIPKDNEKANMFIHEGFKLISQICPEIRIYPNYALFVLGMNGNRFSRSYTFSNINEMLNYKKLAMDAIQAYNKRYSKTKNTLLK